MKQPVVCSYWIRESANPATNIVYLSKKGRNDGRRTLEAMEGSDRKGHSVPHLSDHAGKGHGMIALRLENELLRSKFPGDYLRSWAKRDRDNTGYIYSGILTAGKKPGR